jgi:hypothetical protein
LAWRWSAASKRKGPAAAGGRKDETKIRSLLDGGVVGVGAVRQRYHEERSVRAAASEKREGGGAVPIHFYPSCIGEYREGSLGLARSKPDYQTARSWFRVGLTRAEQGLRSFKFPGFDSLGTIKPSLSGSLTHR